MNFITRSTKVKCIVASVITALALITLIMLSTLLNLTQGSKTLLCFIFSISLMLILLIWQGVVEIQVFNDYKSQNKHLCADGIINLCMGALITICAALFGILQASKILDGAVYTNSDIRIFLVVFIFILLIWKISLTIFSIKQKRFNWWCDLIAIILWAILNILIQISMIVKVSSITTIAWIIIINSWLIIAETIFYILFSYIIKTPNYLETKTAIDIKKEEQLKEKFINRDKSNKKVSIEEKLKHLKELKENNLITEEDYQKMKETLLDENI